MRKAMCFLDVTIGGETVPWSAVRLVCAPPNRNPWEPQPIFEHVRAWRVELRDGRVLWSEGDQTWHDPLECPNCIEEKARRPRKPASHGAAANDAPAGR